MATFEENTMETIEKIVRNLDTMTKSIVDLYGKIEELNKSTMKIIELTSKEKKEPQTGLNGIMEQIENLEVPKTDDCDFCCGTGVVLVEDFAGQYIDKCPLCHGTGKNKSITKSTLCPVCNGTGYIETEPGAFVECFRCHGTGKTKRLESEVM